MLTSKTNFSAQNTHFNLKVLGVISKDNFVAVKQVFNGGIYDFRNTK